MLAKPPTQSLLGKAGEIAFETAFRPGKPLDVEAERRRIEREILRRLAAYSGWIDSAVRRVISETAQGMVQVRKAYKEAYGQLDLLGRGESQNGLAPCATRFDFVAVRSNGSPVIVEVKNTAGPLGPAARFQAAFYNSVSEEYGIVIRSDSIESDRLVLRPIELRDTAVETLLVGAREGSFEVIRDRTDVGPSRVKEVWEAKQLGYLGKTVETSCSGGCRHHRYLQGISHNFAESSFEPRTPLTLAYGNSLVEAGVDLKRIYYQRILRKEPYRGIWHELLHSYFLTHNRPSKRKEILGITADRLGLDQNILRLLLSADERINAKRLERRIPGDIANWLKLVGKKRIKTARTGGLGVAHRVYGIPVEGERFLRDCNSEWG